MGDVKIFIFASKHFTFHLSTTEEVNETLFWLGTFGPFHDRFNENRFIL